MHKFIGLLFFYTVVFLNKKEKYDKPWVALSTYINEKADRYLGFDITKSDWELLKIYFKDYPEPDSKDYLQQEHIIGLMDTFHKIFGETYYELRMYGIEEEIEMEQIDMVFEELHKYVSIVGSSNGVSLVLCDWLEKTNYDKKMIHRHINLIEILE